MLTENRYALITKIHTGKINTAQASSETTNSSTSATR